MLLDIDGVLYVGEEPIEGAHAALGELRALAAACGWSRTRPPARAARSPSTPRLGFEVAPEEVLTPAALAVRLLP